MKLSIKAIIAAAAVLIPALAFAQSSVPLTRAQVRAQLIELEKAGYNPAADSSGDYPEGLARAEAVVAQKQTEANAAYGPASNGTVQAGK